LKVTSYFKYLYLIKVCVLTDFKTRVMGVGLLYMGYGLTELSIFVVLIFPADYTSCLLIDEI